MKVTINLSEQDERDFLFKCYQDGTTPAEVLGGFIADLIDGEHTRGSDERRLAREYYERCGYYADKETFVSFLIYHYGWEALEDIYQEEEDEAARGYYEVYTENTENPESLEDGIAAIMNLMERGNG